MGWPSQKRRGQGSRWPVAAVPRVRWRHAGGSSADRGWDPRPVFDGHVPWRDIGPQPVYAVSGESANFSWRDGVVNIEGNYSPAAERIADQLGRRVQGDDGD
ncbi:hypothetical protein GCM10007977_083720 [Dactylosporangium sucinum]|uniref:Uncharacterized protein n=1 Tax=Dactylosporangium sucinum TaxID=1424081 RepID=A0A917U9Z7_9ACTN|nr:hypothetical protein GCM10007977_083720 [Dactylosporangium sucinum]